MEYDLLIVGSLGWTAPGSAHTLGHWLQESLRQFFIFRRVCLNLFCEPPTLGDTGIWQGTQTINLPSSKTEGLWQRARFSLKHVSRAVNTHPCALLSLERAAVPRASLWGTSQLDSAISSLPSAHLWVKMLCISCACINISAGNVRNPLGLFQQLLRALAYPKSPSSVLSSVSVLPKLLRAMLFWWCF